MFILYIMQMVLDMSLRTRGNNYAYQNQIVAKLSMYTKYVYIFFWHTKHIANFLVDYMGIKIQH